MYVVVCSAVVAVAAAVVVKFESWDPDLDDAHKLMQLVRKASIPERYRPDSYFKKLVNMVTVSLYVWFNILAVIVLQMSSNILLSVYIYVCFIYILKSVKHTERDVAPC